jgi:hypothetical protein
VTKKKVPTRKKRTVKIRHPINGPFERVQIDCSKDGVTKQEFQKDCDINRIMAKYQKTGVINHLSKWGEQYGEIPATDLMEAHLISERAGEMFRELPSSLRNKFEGDPVKFLQFVQDPENVGELGELGLLRGEPPEPPQPTKPAEKPPVETEAKTPENGSEEPSGGE